MARLIPRKYKAIILGLIDCFFKKNSKKIMIVVKNRTEFSGNLRVVTDLLLKDKQYNVYIYKDGNFVPQIKKLLSQKGVNILEGWSFISLYHLLTSRFYIFSHSPRDAHLTKKCKNRVIINLWHGVPFKKIEMLMPFIDKKKEIQIENNSKLIDLLIASSETDKLVMMEAFKLPSSKVKITGLPRYDILKDSYILDSFLQEQKEKILKNKKNKKLILYAPTFREENISAIEQITNDEWDILNQLLIDTNSIMGIRTHSYDNSIPSYIKDNENFFLLSQKEYTETNLILQFVDILIVDFSSIWIDFLLLKRPIIGFAKDYENYHNKERGFIYDFENTFPGNFLYSIEKLSFNLYKLINSSKNIEYKEALSKFHKYSLDFDFSEKIKKEIYEKIN